MRLSGQKFSSHCVKGVKWNEEGTSDHSGGCLVLHNSPLFIHMAQRSPVFYLRDEETFSSLQAKLLCQSGVVLAKEKLKNGQIPSSLSFSLPEGEKIFVSFQPDETRTEVKVEVVGEVGGRRFSQKVNFSFPEGIGDKAISVFFCDPESRIPFSPYPLSLGKGLVRASLVLTLDEGAKVLPAKPFLGVEGKVLLVSAKMGIWSLGLFQTKKVFSLLMVGGKSLTFQVLFYQLPLRTYKP